MRFPLEMPVGRKFDVFGFGTNAVDFLITVPEFPSFASKAELSRYTRAAGGEVATTMVGLQRLGMRTSYAGRFGADDAGEFGMKSLNEENVDLQYSEKISGAETQIAFIVIDERTGERTVIWKRDEKLGFSESEAPLKGVDGCRILHMTPHDTKACISLAKRARDLNVRVSLDIDNIFDGVDELLPLVDILAVSSEFPKKLLGIDDYETALQETRRRFGNALIAITLGNHGSVAISGDQIIETKGFDVPGGCKDTTGAGDAFRAGLLYGLLSRKTVEESLKMANAVAVLKCRAVGARTSLPTPTELNGFLKKA